MKCIRAYALALATFLFATIAPAAPAPGAAEPVAQLLDLLGVRALLEQTPAVLAAAADAETQFRQTAAQPVNWRRGVEAQLKSEQVQQDVVRYVRERARSDVIRQAQQRLQEPLVKRVRYFDLAMTQSGAEKNLRDFLAKDVSAPNKVHGADAIDIANNADIASKADSAGKTGGPDKNGEVNRSDDRRALMRDIDAATATSLLMATLQSAVAARVHQALDKSAGEAGDLQEEIVERQRFLAPLSANYLLYDYRYLREDELRDYRDLMRDEAVQTLLTLSREAIATAVAGPLAAKLTPPPDPPQ